jgi:hypothetical protein
MNLLSVSKSSGRCRVDGNELSMSVVLLDLKFKDLIELRSYILSLIASKKNWRYLKNGVE